MVVNKLYLDYLTDLYNEQYFKKIYTSYILENKHSNLIIIDFEKFKFINDTYGHSIGDAYLKVFSNILKKVFSHSIVFRLHGDEFAILTELSENDIMLKFQQCDKLVQQAVENKKIPKLFGYNAGSCPATLNVDETNEKADFMMYFAKREGERYQPFSENIWKRKLLQKKYISNINELIETDSFTFSSRQLFNKKMEKQPIYQVLSKDKNGSSLLLDYQYDILRNNSMIKTLDMYNIEKILNNFDIVNDKMIIDIDYTTLTVGEDLIKIIGNMSSILTLNTSDVVLSINVSGIESSNYYSIVNAINILKGLGYKICLSKYDTKISDELWLNTDIDYIKFDNMFLKQAMVDPKYDYYLKSKVDMFANYDKCMPIFLDIQRQKEHEYLASFDTDNILLGGDYYSNEKKLVLQKK